MCRFGAFNLTFEEHISINKLSNYHILQMICREDDLRSFLFGKGDSL